MIGLSSNSKEQINKFVEDIFDRIALHFLGEIPKLKHKKLMIFSSEKNYSLPHLFIQSMGNMSPNVVEQDALKSLLNSSYSYIDALKSKTSANLAERIDGLAKEAKIKKTRIPVSAVSEAIQEEMDKARSHLNTIVETESTKLRNIGKGMKVTRLAASIGDHDPNVFFVITRDDHVCEECVKLHMMPDKVTPRVWKFSELKQGYHKRGESNPSAFGLHPNCRCTLVYLTPGFGFNSQGLLEYKSKDFNQYEHQKK